MIARSFEAREVKSRCNLVSIASRYTRLRRAGRQYVGLCPFHSERRPSFYVHPDKKIFHCFGCGAGGDVFDFVIQAERSDFPRSLAIVAGELPSSRRAVPERESYSAIAARIVALLPASGFVPSCPRCLAPMDFRAYRGNRFGGVYRCQSCRLFFGPKELRAWLIRERGASCQWCSESGCDVQMHHISKRGSQFEPASIVLLCPGCHADFRKVLALHRGFERRSREWPERSEGHLSHSPDAARSEPRSGSRFRARPLLVNRRITGRE